MMERDQAALAMPDSYWYIEGIDLRTAPLSRAVETPDAYRVEVYGPDAEAIRDELTRLTAPWPEPVQARFQELLAFSVATCMFAKTYRGPYREKPHPAGWICPTTRL